MSIQAISELTGGTARRFAYNRQQEWCRSTAHVQRSRASSMRQEPYLEERLRAGVWNARVLLANCAAELRRYTTILTDWLRPQRSATRVVAVRRFERLGKQRQGMGQFGYVELAGKTEATRFHLHAGYSRRM